MEKESEGTAQGYITDVPYTIKYHMRQLPSQMASAAWIVGVPAPDLDRPFTYADFGCGRGLTLLILASMYPHSRFFGIDVNEEHVEEVSARAERAGLTNVCFLARSFDDLSEDDLPPLDFASAHGLLSWVNEKVRLALRDAIARHLKPEGLALVSYNVAACFDALRPVQGFMRRIASSAPGDQTERRRQAISVLRRLRETEQSFFVHHPRAGGYVDDWAKHDESYLFHEYFNENWNPLSFGEVSTEMRAAGLNFLGDSVYPSWIAGKGKASRAPWMEDSYLLEDLASFSTAQAFRYDHFTKALFFDIRRLPAVPPELRFGLTQPSDSPQMLVAREKNTLAARVLDGLAAGPLSYAEISDLPAMRGRSAHTRARTLRSCMFQGVVTPWSGSAEPMQDVAEAVPLKVTTSLAASLLSDRSLARHSLPLPASNIGAAVMVPPMVAAVLAAVVEGAGDVAEHAAQRVYQMTGVDPDGQKRESLEQIRERMPGSIDRYRRIWRPYLLASGVIAPR